MTTFPWQTGVEWISSFNPSDRVTVECLTSEENNPCRSNPCENGGLCLNGFSTFHCICETEWSGKTCNDTSKF